MQNNEKGITNTDTYFNSDGFVMIPNYFVQTKGAKDIDKLHKSWKYIIPVFRALNLMYSSIHQCGYTNYMQIMDLMQISYSKASRMKEHIVYSLEMLKSLELINVHEGVDFNSLEKNDNFFYFVDIDKFKNESMTFVKLNNEEYQRIVNYKSDDKASAKVQLGMLHTYLCIDSQIFEVEGNEKDYLICAFENICLSIGTRDPHTISSYLKPLEEIELMYTRQRGIQTSELNNETKNLPTVWTINHGSESKINKALNTGINKAVRDAEEAGYTVKYALKDDYSMERKRLQNKMNGFITQGNQYEIDRHQEMLDNYDNYFGLVQTYGKENVTYEMFEANMYMKKEVGFADTNENEKLYAVIHTQTGEVIGKIGQHDKDNDLGMIELVYKLRTGEIIDLDEFRSEKSKDTKAKMDVQMIADEMRGGLAVPDDVIADSVLERTMRENEAKAKGRQEDKRPTLRDLKSNGNRRTESKSKFKVVNPFEHLFN